MTAGMGCRLFVFLHQGSLKDTFCHLKHGLFPQTKGNHVQGNAQVYNVRIPVHVWIDKDLAIQVFSLAIWLPISSL